jgi:hypothetical protein
MALDFPARNYVANAVAGTLSAALTNTSTTFTSSTSLSSWLNVETGSALPAGAKLVVAVEYGTANEEKILCTYNAGTFTIVNRNYNNETSFPIDGSHTHPAGKTFILVWSATEAAEAQRAVQTLKNVMLNSGVATTPANVGIDITATAGTSKYVPSVDHTHSLNSADLNTWLASTSLTGLSVTAANVTYNVIPETTSYSVTTADASSILVMNNSGSVTVTLPTVFTTVGQSVTIVRGSSAGAVAITGTGVFSTGATAGSPTLRAVGSVATAIYLGSSSWVVTGDIA